MSSSEVLRTASSNAKFGAAENAWVLVAIAWTHRAGLWRNATGLMISA